MKKALILSILLTMILIFCKFFISNYEINYKVNDYEVKTIYKNKRFYTEIKKDDKTYNFDYYSKRKLPKTLISNIDEILGDDFNCIYPSIDGIETYPLCYNDNQFIDYHLIDSELLDIYKSNKVTIDKNDKDYIYYNNLSKNEYVALWNYKGYIIMNDKNYNMIEMFAKDRYDNTLSYLIDDTLYIADYNQEHEYNKLITLNLVSQKISEILLDNNVDFDSYFVGNIDSKLYLFDNKYSILYEIDTNKNKVDIKGTNEKGFVKYQDGKFINCSKSEYKVNKIKYSINNSLYEYKNNDGFYKIILENKKLAQKINNDNVNIVGEYKNRVYYSLNDNFYFYEPNIGETKIFYNYELTFNNKNTIFVYNK